MSYGDMKRGRSCALRPRFIALGSPTYLRRVEASVAPPAEAQARQRQANHSQRTRFRNSNREILIAGEVVEVHAREGADKAAAAVAAQVARAGVQTGESLVGVVVVVAVAIDGVDLDEVAEVGLPMSASAIENSRPVVTAAAAAWFAAAVPPVTPALLLLLNPNSSGLADKARQRAVADIVRPVVSRDSPRRFARRCRRQSWRRRR